MSFESGTAPRRLLQTHGAFINAVLAPNLKQKRHWGTGSVMKMNENVESTAQQNVAKRMNQNMGFVANDEVFDAREGEILVNSLTESGFPAHRRGALFSSLNGYKVRGDNLQAADLEPRTALHRSDMRYVGLCQNSFVSSNTALAEQGMAVQVSGIKTIINDSEETINIGDRLMVDTMQKTPSKTRKGIPNEKVRLVLRKVPKNFVPQTTMDEVSRILVKEFARIQEANANLEDGEAPIRGKYGILNEDGQIGLFEAELNNLIALVILQFRKAGHWVVGVAENSARHGEQLDVLLTKPSFL